MEDKEFLRRIIKEKLFWVVRWSRSFMKVKKKWRKKEKPLKVSDLNRHFKIKSMELI